MKARSNIGLLAIVGLILINCLDPYTPPASRQEAGYLVVDGFINVSEGSASVRLSTALKLEETITFPAIDNAIATIEDTEGNNVLLIQQTPGFYKAFYPFEMRTKYKMKISYNGKSYESNFISMQQNAEIDSLAFSADSEGLTLYVNTHDFTEGYKYYRYSFEETYNYNSRFDSQYEIVDNSILYRSADKGVYNCWKTQPSTNILLADTELLNQNLIANKVILKILRGDRRLWKKYSLLVKQVSLDKEAHYYWSQLEKVTESLGGLFDPIPYSVKGNLFCTSDATERVLGYFSGGEVTIKRIVIANQDLPKGYDGILINNCIENYVTVGEVSSIFNRNILITRADYIGPFIQGYYYSDPTCTDCRLEGGSNVEPYFMK